MKKRWRLAICLGSLSGEQSLALVMATGLPAGRAWRAWLLVIVLTTLQAAVVTAAVRRGEVRVPQVLSQWTPWTGVKEAFPLGLLHAHLGVPHPSSYLQKKYSCQKQHEKFILWKKRVVLISL